MGTATGFNAARMLAIEESTVVNGFVDLGGNLILQRRDGDTINAGLVKGPKGDTGDSFTLAAGFIQPFSGSVPPAGWMLCDGSELLRAQYPELFAVIGTTYGSSGPLYFNLPDYRGRTLVGRDGAQIEFDTIGKIGGAKTHILTIAEMPSHSHQWAAAGTNNPGSTPANYDDIVGANAFALGTGPTDPESSANAIKPRGGGAAHNNLQPFSVVNYVISLGVNASVGGGTPIVAQYQGRGTTAERNTIYGIPGTDAQIVDLANQRVQWFNTELGWMEQYFATTGLVGLGVKGLVTGAPSGWYPVGHGPYQRLRPNTTFAATANNPVRNWNGQTFRNGGSAWFTYNNTNGRVQILNAGRYEIKVFTTQQTGTGTANYHLRQMNAGVTEQHVDGLAFTLVSTLYTHPEVNAEMLILPNREIDFFLHSGTLTVHSGGGTTIPGQFEVVYLGPPLASD